MIIYMEETTIFLQQKSRLPEEVFKAEDKRKTMQGINYIVIK